MILHLENPKDKNETKLLQLINQFSQGAGCKVETQISIAFLYTNKEQSGKQI